jgi:uncharacterized protein YndB with AHSA1/START domain
MATGSQHATTLQLRRTFPAPRERVFRAWTTPEEMKRWQAPRPMTTPFAEVDLRVGGRYRIHMRAPDGAEHRVAGVYREVDPPRRLVYTWAWESGPDQTETLVTVEFFDRGGATEVVLTHALFSSEEARGRHEHGWTGCLDNLAEALAADSA